MARLRRNADALVVILLATMCAVVVHVSAAFLALALGACFSVIRCFYALPESGAEHRFGRRRLPDRSLVELMVVLLVVYTLVVAPTWDLIGLRLQAGPHRYAQDGLIQTEEAIKFLLHGENPYAVTYEHTPQARWDGAGDGYNPALYNFVYLPVVFLLGVPFHLLSRVALGWYDHRIAYLLCFCVALWVYRRLAKGRAEGLIAVALVGLYPLRAPFVIQGRNDIVLIALVGLSLQCLAWSEPQWGYAASGVCFGLACAMKHTAWFLAPFYVLYLWGNWPVREPGCSSWDKARAISRTWALPAGSAAAACLIPFFVWNPARFWEATVLYLSGGGSHPYPILRTQAFGLPMLLASPDVWRLLDAASSGPFGFLRPFLEGLKIRSGYQAFPFWFFQGGLALPVLGLALHRQWCRNTLASALSGYAVTLFAYQFCSRYFLNSHLGYVVLLYCFAFLVRDPLACNGSAAMQPSDAPSVVLRAAGTPRLVPRGVLAIRPLVPLLASYYVATEWRVLGGFVAVPVALTLLFMVLALPPASPSTGGRTRVTALLPLARTATLLALMLSVLPL